MSQTHTQEQQIRDAMWSLECWQDQHDILLDERKAAQKTLDFLDHQIARAVKGAEVTRAKLNELGVPV